MGSPDQKFGDGSKLLGQERDSGVRMRAEDSAEKEQEVAEKIAEMARLNQSLMVFIMDEFPRLTAELSSALSMLIIDSQKPGFTLEQFNAEMAKIKLEDVKRTSNHSLYFTAHLSRWLARRPVIRLNDKGEEETWEIKLADIRDLNKPEPVVALQQLRPPYSMPTVSLYETFQALYRQLLKDARERENVRKAKMASVPKK